MPRKDAKQEFKVFPEQGMVMQVGYLGKPKIFTGQVVVIGTGRFGNGVAQGVRESYVQISDGKMLKVNVDQVSCTQFMALDVEDMADKLAGSDYVCYTGIFLPQYAGKLARAMQMAASMNASAPLEFMDFSNPDPTIEESDVPGALHMWRALNCQGFEGHFKVWKITETGSLDVSGNEEPHHDYAKVYGAGIAMGEVPKLKVTGLRWVAAESGRSDLFAEAYDRIMERSEIDRWYDGCILGLAVTLFTCGYAVCRYSEHMNGSYPNSMIPMYILDKGVAWTALWMMVVSPFAGNLLALRAIWLRWEKTGTMDRLVWLFSLLVMAFPIFEFTLCWGMWYILRNLFFRFCLGRNPAFMYLAQAPTTDTKAVPKACQGEKHFLYPDATQGTKNSMMAMMVDMVSLKGESGCVGFVYALAHSFIGFIVADAAYKKWFDKETGRLFWNIEVCLMTGCISTALLFCVALRSLFGKASWIRMKPLYAYMSPIGIWLAVVHVVMFGYKGWYKLFKYEYHNGQPSITFMSSFFPAGVLLVNFLLGALGTKRRLGNQHLWKHSATNFAKLQWVKLQHTLDQQTGMGDNTSRTHTGMGNSSRMGRMDTSAQYLIEMSDTSSDGSPKKDTPWLTDELDAFGKELDC